MRFMMLMIPNVSEDNWEPTPEAVGAMARYNEELSKAGVLLALDGLRPSAKGAPSLVRGWQAERHGRHRSRKPRR